MSGSQRFEMYSFYGKINWGQVSRPFYRGFPLFRGSVIRGFTVQHVKLSDALKIRNGIMFDFHPGLILM